MHELSLMAALRDQALAEARRHGAEQITAIRLRIGSLAGVEPDALQLAYAVVMEGSIAAGAELVIELVPARCWCRSCEACFVADQGVCECPRCGTLSRELRQGRELQLVSRESS